MPGREARVRELMTSPVVTMQMTNSLPLADALMDLERIRHVIIVDDANRVVGLVSHRDVLAAQITALGPLSGTERSTLELVVPVSRLMRTAVWTVASSALASTAARLMREHRFGCLPVVDDGKLVGIITESDLLSLVERLSDIDAPPRPLTVEGAMTLFPLTISPTTSIAEARAMMDRYDVRHLPVTEGNHPIGIVGDRDLRIAEAIYRQRAGDASAQLAVALVGFDVLYEVAPTQNLDEVLLEMSTRRVSAAMVVDAGQLVGIITTVDVCRLFGQHLRAKQVRALEGS